MIGAADAVVDQPPWWDLTVADIERRSVDVAVLRVVPHAPLPYARRPVDRGRGAPAPPAVAVLHARVRCRGPTVGSSSTSAWSAADPVSTAIVQSTHAR